MTSRQANAKIRTIKKARCAPCMDSINRAQRCGSCHYERMMIALNKVAEAGV